MALYQCTVLNNLGEKQFITMEAIDVETLRGLLKREQYILLSFSLISEKKKNAFFALSSKARTNEIVGFYRQFSVMIKSGISIIECIKILRSQKYSTPFYNALQAVHYDIEAGVLLSEAFSRHTKIFPEFFVNMVAIGEASGTLDRVLSDMADHYENERKIKERISSALAYPILLLIMVVAVVLFLTLFVFPQFETTLLAFGGELPKITKVLISCSEFIRKYYFVIIPAISLITAACIVFFKTKSGRYIKDCIVIKLPIIGKIQLYLITARFSKAFVMLLRSGMNIVDCLENLQKMLGNKMFQKKFKFTIDEVKRGKRIAYSLEKIRIFPLMLTEMINVGEKSGSLDEMLVSTGDYFTNRAENSISSALKMIEPAIIILIGLIVAVVVFGVMLPFMSIMGNI